MSNVKIPGVLPVALILLLPPAIIPVIQQFFPANTYWWAALIIAVLNVVVIAVRISWPDQSSKVPYAMSAEGPVGAHAGAAKDEQSTIAKFLLGV